MGAGRKTISFTLSHDVEYTSGYGTMYGRNLKKKQLAGVIFGCKFSTIKECYAKNLFGLPAPHMAYIQNIDPGMTLFLFNYSNRTLHGVFEATSEGKLNIDPKAWSSNGTDSSPYPAQVRVRVRTLCEPLSEREFGPVIAKNYRDEKMFWFELDRCQTKKLLCLFSPPLLVRAPREAAPPPGPPPRKPIPASSLVKICDLGARRVDKWSSLFKTSDDSSEKKEQDSQQYADGASSSLINLAKAQQPSMSQLGTYQENQEVENHLSFASQVLTLPQDNGGYTNVADVVNVIGPSNEDHAQDPYSELDFDVYLEGVERILDDPPEDYKNFAYNMGPSCSYMVPNLWDHVNIPLDFDQRNKGKAPCGSSYVSGITGNNIDDIGRMDYFTCMDTLRHMVLEVNELKHIQFKQDQRIFSLEMQLIQSRMEVLRLKLKGMNGSF